MDKDHRLDAPDNETLRTIEQLDDRSELSTLYPNPHKEWEGTDILSTLDRERKRNDAQDRINLTIRRWFPILGILLPLPVVITALTFVFAYRFLSHADKLALLLPVMALVAIVAWLSYRSIKTIYAIFYNHAMGATLFIYTVGWYLICSIPGIFTLLNPALGDDYVINALILCGGFLALSIIYSGIVIYLWSAKKLSGRTKLSIATVIGTILLASGLYFLIT